MNKKRLIIIIDSLKSGGAEKVLIEILNKLNYDKYLVDLLLINKVGEYMENIPNDVEIFNLIDTYNRKPTIVDKIRFRLYYNNPKFINKLLKERYDIGIAFLEGDSTRILSRLNNINYKIAWVHTDVTRHCINSSYDVYRNINKIICVSNNSKDRFLEKYNIDKNKLKVIYNPIDKDKIVELSNKYNLQLDSKINIISVGRLVKEKGFDILIKAISELIKKKINVHLYIIGEGTERSNLEELIKNLNLESNITLVGFKKNPYPYIRCGDICVSSSLYEGFSLFLAEAMVLGKSIVSTETQGAIELLDNGKLGLLCKCNSVDSLVNKLELIINEKEPQNNNLDSNISKFDINNVLDEIENLISNI